MSETALVYRYAGASQCSASDGRTVMSLATSGGEVARPRFFDGEVGPPRATARALMTVARVARTRFEIGMTSKARQTLSRDPVVTVGDGVLRFESFSACGGVYARADLRGADVDRGTIASGTTNVDVNEPLRRALAQVTDKMPLRVEVGSEDIAVAAGDRRIVERKVPLPERWLRGLGEVQVASSRMVLRAELKGLAARRFLQTLPGPSDTPLWLVPSDSTFRLSHRGDDDAIPFTGPHRLSLAGDLADMVTSLRIHAPRPTMRATVGSAAATPVSTATAWEMVLGVEGPRMWLVMSPSVRRGFSGDGGMLFALALGLPDALAAASGRVGFDLATGRWFERPLPFDETTTAIEAMHPRLRDARQLIGSEGVDVRSLDAVVVRTSDSVHRVNLTGPAPTCTCSWYARHRGERGPCNHVLAAVMAAPADLTPSGLEAW